jgi:hypothetical protein
MKTACSTQAECKYDTHACGFFIQKKMHGEKKTIIRKMGMMITGKYFGQNRKA